MKTLVFVGYFLAQCVDVESSGQTNILFEYLASSKGKAHPLIAHWEKAPSSFKRKSIYHLQVKAECESSFEVREGNGKSGRGWAPQDDWIFNGSSLHCNATEVKILSESTLAPCEAHSLDCNVCDD
jgi:hypothetical protein